MSKDKSSLGTGLDSLLGDRPKAEGLSVAQIALDDLTPGQYQPRSKMYKSTLEELSQSIKEQGVLQPLVIWQPQPRLRFDSLEPCILFKEYALRSGLKNE